MPMNESYHLFAMALQSMNERSFFALAKNYLGTLPSPLNRSKITHQLADFLLKPATLAAIRERLDEEDCAYLSVPFLHQNPSGETFRSFFPFTSLEITETKLNNLQERLLLLFDARTKTYQLNPLLAPALSTLHLGEAYLLTASPVSDEESAHFWLDDSLLTATLALISQQVKESLWATQIPSLNSNNQLILKESLTSLGLLEEKSINLSVLRELSTLSPSDRLSYCIAGYVSGDSAEQLILARLVTTLFTSYSASLFDEQLIGRLYFMECGKTLSRNFFERLTAFNLWQKKDKKFLLHHINTAPPKPLLIETDFSCYFMPDSAFSPVLACCFRLKRFDTVSQYGLDRDSFFNGMNSGYTSEQVFDDLITFSACQLPQNLHSNLIHWQQHFSSATLYQGYILQLSPDKEKLAQTSGWLAEFTYKKLTAGLYLLNKEPSPALFAVLDKMGCPLPKIDKIRPSSKNHFYQLSSVQHKPVPAQPVRLQENRQIIEELLNQTEDHEIRRRIRRKILLSPEHLNTPYTKLQEASGFDFQAKLRLIRYAMSHHNYLELDMVKDLDIITLYVRPLSVTKDGDHYYLEAINQDSFKTIKMPIQHIATVRLIQQSLIF